MRIGPLCLAQSSVVLVRFVISFLSGISYSFTGKVFPKNSKLCVSCKRSLIKIRPNNVVTQKSTPHFHVFTDLFLQFVGDFLRS